MKDDLLAENLLRELHEEAPTAYLTADLAGRITAANRRACELLGRAAADLVGTSLFDHAADGPAGRERLRRAHDEFLTGPGPASLEVEMRRGDGRALWLAAWFRAAHGPDGRTIGSRSAWVDVTDRVLAQQEKAWLAQQNLYLQEEVRAEHNFEEIVGRSPALLSILDAAHRVAGTDSTVLIVGETGTGKELIARAIHAASRRRDRPLIKVDCAGRCAERVESELFGHDGDGRRPSRFELAHGSTLLLDEVGELSAGAQARLLHVLQKRALERAGGPALRLDVRVLATTNRDLPARVRAGGFRDDLYRRLSSFALRLPPLRDRKEDIPLLVHFLLGKFIARLGKRIDSVAQETMCRLGAYAWPGNVRELSNVVERAVLLSTGPVLEIGTDVLHLPGLPAHGGHCPTTLEAAERQHILGVLGQTSWVIDGPAGAARILGLHPNTLRSRLKKLGIHRPGHAVPRKG